jgi:nucleotide-binding universal stress UspA family protein
VTGMEWSTHTFRSALIDFHRARRRAGIEKVLASLTGNSADLLSFEEIRRKLKEEARIERGLKDIPLDAIVGSVGRYDDFTRSFLPLQKIDGQRWARVEMAATGLIGVPPIEVYQIGDAYFVLDGNHRVSVARELGATHIHAYVTEVRTRVSLSSDDQPDSLIVKAEYADFLEQTRLDKLHPKADLSVSVPGQYDVLREHIQVHRYFLGLEQEREIPYEEAVAHWYDEVYWPVVEAIRGCNVLRDFPGRTETDLYLWVSEHRAGLERELGWEIEPTEAALHLISQSSPSPWHVVARLRDRVLEAVTPNELKTGPSPGEWRERRLTTCPYDRLFADVLVAVSGDEAGWRAVEQAMEIARREGGRLRGLHVVGSEDQLDTEEIQSLKIEFRRCCEGIGIQGKLAVVAGDVADTICARARWTDLVVLNVSYPPDPLPVARLSSGFRAIVQKCPTPVLAVRDGVSPLRRALLAYDGSGKADEGLFVGTDLSGQWNLPLVVLTVAENDETASKTLTHAREYLELHGVQATFVRKEGAVADEILAVAEEHETDLLVMGGYGFSPVLHIALGSTVDKVLRKGRQPVLICR